MNIAIVDTEATSKIGREAELIEVAAVLCSVDHRGDEEGRPTVVLDERLDEYSALNQPSSPIPQDVVDLTGITDGLVEGHRIDVSSITAFLRRADVVVAHNAAFDRAVLERAGLPPMRWACSLKMIDWPYQLTGASLEALARRFRLPYPEQNAHRAMADVQVLSWLLGCSSAWEHRRKHPTFLAELLESAEAEWGVLMADPGRHGYDAIYDLGGYRWSKLQKVLYRETRRDRARAEIYPQLVQAYGDPATARQNVQFVSCDITTDFETRLGLQKPKRAEVAA